MQSEFCHCYQGLLATCYGTGLGEFMSLGGRRLSAWLYPPDEWHLLILAAESIQTKGTGPIFFPHHYREISSNMMSAVMYACII